MALERRRIDHLHDDIRRSKRRRRPLRFVLGDRRSFVAQSKYLSVDGPARSVSRSDRRLGRSITCASSSPMRTAHSSYARGVPASAPLCTDVLATARNTVLLPPPGKPRAQSAAGAHRDRAGGAGNPDSPDGLLHRVFSTVSQFAQKDYLAAERGSKLVSISASFAIVFASGAGSRR